MLATLPLLATLVVAVLHVGFFVLEAVLWTTPAVRRRFGQTAEAAEVTKVLAANQGFYNLGVAALLAWAALAGEPHAAAAVLLFVIAMGVVGAATAKASILVVQSLPAAIALILVLRA